MSGEKKIIDSEVAPLETKIGPYFRFEDAKLDAEGFMSRYKSVILLEVANGRPATNTFKSYFYAIDGFLSWCMSKEVKEALKLRKKEDILYLQEVHLKFYRTYLESKEMKTSTIDLKLQAISRFYECAVKYSILDKNPAENIRAIKKRKRGAALLTNKALTELELQLVLHLIPVQDDKGRIILRNLRDKLMIVLMGIEGLRRTEVVRMSLEDILTDNSLIYIHGKGSDEYIYPREDTWKLLHQYIKLVKDFVKPDSEGIPIFTSLSNNCRGKRLYPESINMNINKWFKIAGVRLEDFTRRPGQRRRSCHALRHACGSLIYKETKDLQAVAKTLRHSNIQTASIYAELYDRMENRYTETIRVKF